MAKGSGGKLAEANQEVVGDFKLAALVTQLNDLATKISKVENQCKSQMRHIPQYERERSRSNENKRIDDMLLIILQKIREQDRMLEVIRENVEVLNQMSGSHSRAIKLIEDLLDHTLPHLYPSSKGGLPSGIRFNPKDNVSLVKTKNVLKSAGLRTTESTWRVAEGSYFTFCSSVLSPEGKDQIGGKTEQSVHRQKVPLISTVSANDPEHDDVKGWCKTAMNYTKGRIAELIGDSD
uniref:Uncharacterized protein n=1 Tax=Solanum tuberosum TaxID=4113 RepID=M1DSP8_SOLTU